MPIYLPTMHVYVYIHRRKTVGHRACGTSRKHLHQWPKWEGVGEGDYPTHMCHGQFPRLVPQRDAREHPRAPSPPLLSTLLGVPPPPTLIALLPSDKISAHHIANSATTALASRVERGTPSLYFGHRPHVIDG